MLRRVFSHGRRVVTREVDHARRTSERRLTLEEAQFVAVAALGVVSLTLVGHMMYFAKYANLTREDLWTFHPHVPVLYLASHALFIGAMYVKGIRYWLAYFPAVVGIVSSLVFLGLYYGAIEPSAMRIFDWGPRWWRGT